MATDFSKHRLESVKLAADFSDVLNTGASLSAVAGLLVTKQNTTTLAWEDVSSEFGGPTGTVVGDTVEFTLGAAGAGEQDAGERYRVQIRATTSDGETLVAVPKLDVQEFGDPSAP